MRPYHDYSPRTCHTASHFESLNERERITGEIPVPLVEIIPRRILKIEGSGVHVIADDGTFCALHKQYLFVYIHSWILENELQDLREIRIRLPGSEATLTLNGKIWQELASSDLKGDFDRIWMRQLERKNRRTKGVITER
jgi:hypothetical protein